MRPYRLLAALYFGEVDDSTDNQEKAQYNKLIMSSFPKFIIMFFCSSQFNDQY